MSRLAALTRHLLYSQSGNAGMEYALFLSLITLAVVAGLGIVGSEISGFFNSTGNAIGGLAS